MGLGCYIDPHLVQNPPIGELLGKLGLGKIEKNDENAFFGWGEGGKGMELCLYVWRRGRGDVHATTPDPPHSKQSELSRASASPMDIPANVMVAAAREMSP